MNDNYALISKDSITINPTSPEIRLARTVFSGNYGANAYAINNLAENTASTLYALTEREHEVLTLSFGLSNGTPMAKEELSSKLDLTVDRIEQIEAKAVRKIRPASRSEKLTGIFSRDSDLGKKLYEEVQGLIRYGYNSSIYLSHILERNNITIHTSTRPDIQYLNKSLDELPLSTRSYNSFRRAGYYTLSEIKAALAQKKEGEIRDVFFGRKALEEILQIVSDENLPDILTEDTSGRLIELSMIINGQKTVYKYFERDEDMIIKDIFNQIVELKPGFMSILDSRFSYGLKNILLMSGYLYVEDVVSDYENVSKGLICLSLENFSQELKDAREFFEKFPNWNEKVYVIFDEPIIQLILDKNINDHAALINEVLQTENEELLKIVRTAEEYLFSGKEH